MIIDTIKKKLWDHKMTHNENSASHRLDKPNISLSHLAKFINSE